MKDLTQISEEEFEKEVVSFCYNRELCKKLRIDYNNIKRQDVERIRQYLRDIYFVLEERR